MSKLLRRDGVVLGMIVAFVVIFVFSLVVVRPSAQPVQAAVITPIAQTGRDDARIAQYFVTQGITADTRICFDLADFEIMDLQYQVDATSTLSNPTTITTQQTNIDPTAGPFNTGSAVATVVGTDANVMAQVPLFGRWNCVFADVTNSNLVTFTVIGVAK